MLSDLQLDMVPRNSTQLLNINTTKFQVEREPVYLLPYIRKAIKKGGSELFSGFDKFSRWFETFGED